MNNQTESASSSDTFNKQLDMKKIKTWLTEVFKRVDQAEGKVIIPVIGITGNGKSTLINYCLGGEFKRVRKGLQKFAALTKGTEYAKMGQNMLASETLFPQVLQAPGEDVYYCDCPGFNGTRGEEEHICAAVGNQVALKTSKSVQAVLVVIEKAAFSAEKAKGIRDILPMIENLLSEPKKYQSSIFFAITKLDSDDTKADVLETIDEMIKEVKAAVEKAQREGNSAEAADLQKRHTALCVIRENSNNIIISDIFDQGQNRKEIIEKLKGSTPIPQEQFAFPELGSTRVEFNKFVYFVSDAGIKIIDTLLSTPLRIDGLRQKIKAETKRLQENQHKLTHLENDKGIAEGIAELKKQTKDIIDKNEKLITDKKAEIKRLELDNAKQRATLNIYDRDTPVLYWEETYDENKTFGTVLKGVRKIHDFNYNGIAYESHTSNCNKGDQTVHEHNPGGGKFRMTYNGPPDIYGYARVGINVQMRNKPDNKILIDNAKAAITSNDTQITAAREAIKTAQANIDEQNKTLTQGIAEGLKSQAALKKVLAEQLAKEIEANKVVLAQHEAELKKAIDAFNQAREGLKENDTVYQLLVKISQFLTFDSPIVTAFLKKYAQLLTFIKTQPLDDYQFVFTPSAGATASSTASTGKPTDSAGNSAKASSPSASSGVDTHWYDNEEIDALLKHYFKDSKDVELLTAMLGTDWEAGNTLRDCLRDFHVERQKMLDALKEAKNNVVVPINLGNPDGTGRHWVLLNIMYPKNPAEQPLLVYFDPFGVSMPDEVEKAIRDEKVFPKAPLVYSPASLQQDGYNCGTWIVALAHFLIEQFQSAKTADSDFKPEALLDMLTKCVKGYDINLVRKAHMEILHPAAAAASTDTKDDKTKSASGSVPLSQFFKKTTEASGDKSTGAKPAASPAPGK